MKAAEYPFRLYVSIINCIAAVSERIPDKARRGIISAATFCLAAIGIFPYSNSRIKDFIAFDRTAVPVSMLLMILLLIASIDRKFDVRERIRLNAVFWAGWYLCFITMFISARFHHVRAGYNMWSIASLTVFPMLMIVWHRRGDLSSLCSVAARNMVRVSFLFLAVNLIAVPFITNTAEAENMAPGYLGMLANPNSNGLVVLPFYTAALYLLITERRNRIVYVFAASISAMFAVISVTRTAELAMISETLIAVIIAVRCRRTFRNRWDGKVLLCAVIAVALSAAAAAVLIHIDKMDLKSYAATEYDEAAAEVQADETLGKLNSLSSGRIVIWKAYIKSSGLRGHGSPDGPLFEGHKDTQWAHNNALDIWYASGLPAFAGYVIWLLAACFAMIRIIIRKKTFRKEYLLMILAFAGYLTEAMLEITIYPIYTGIAFMAYVTMGPAAFENNMRGEK